MYVLFMKTIKTYSGALKYNNVEQKKNQGNDNEM